MLKRLFEFLRMLVGESVARAMTGAGVALVSFGAITGVTTTALNTAASAFGGMPGDILQIVGLSGLGQALSIVGSAFLTRASIAAMGTFIGKKSP